MIFPNPINFLGAVVRTAWAKIRGYEILTTEQEQDDRLDECDWCDDLTESSQCRVCSCWVQAKTMLTMEACPRKKWRAIWRKKKKRA